MAGQRRFDLPVFDAARQSLVIPTVVQDTLVRSAISSELSRYQTKHQIIEPLTISRDRTFKTHYLAGSPLLWQKDNGGCSIDPMGSQGITTKTLTPERLRAFMKWCPKEVYDSIFQATMQWTRSGTQDMSELSGLIAPMLKEDAAQLSISLMGVALLGQLFDWQSIGFNGNATTQQQVDFAKQADAFKGLFSKILDLNAQHSYMYNSSILPDSFNVSGGYSGIDISEVAQSLYASSHADLKLLVNKGSQRDGRGGTVMPKLIVSDNIIADIWRKAKEVADTTLQNDSILREITVRVEDGVQDYYWRNIPIIPLSEVCMYDSYLNSNFVFAALTCSRNIQIGTSFSTFFGAEEYEVGSVIQRVADNDIKDGDAGSYYRDSHALMACDIANPKLWSSTFKTYANG